MARRKYTEKDISKLLETNSSEDIQKDEDSTSSDSSQSEIFNKNKSLLIQSRVLQKRQASLRLKLRRSTEQSLYKIDTESEDEQPRRSVKNSRSLQNVCEYQISRRKRCIKFPIRYSDYECYSSNKLPVSQEEQINYNEEKLVVTPSRTIKSKKQFDKCKKDNASDNANDLDCVCCNFIPRTPSISSGISKDEECKKQAKDKELHNEEITVFKKDTKVHESIDDTPRRRRNEKRIHKDISIVSNKCDSINENESNNEMDDICEVAKELSIKPKERKKSLKSTATESSVPSKFPITPKSSQRLSLRHSTLIPSVKERTQVLAKPVTPLQELRFRLHVSAVPKSLPCREQEFNDIYAFLESKLMDNSGGCVYISGVPGTGKTATVNEVVKCLKRSVEKGKLNNFNFIEINGMKLTEPRQAYIQILKQLSGKIFTWEQAYNTLEKRFNSNTKKSMTLLLVDELDLLCTKRQDVVYNILDWPTKISARLVVITIANTMDLPERVLMGRVTSRLGLTRITFQPYNHKQLQQIVLARLKDTDIFKSEAIQLIARKVSAVSGDARRALDICRRAAEITETRNGTTITMQDVNEALSEMLTNPKVQAIRHCSKFEQIFLQAVCAEVTRTGIEEVCFLNVYKQFESLCIFDGYEAPNITVMLDVCTRLGDYRLLICEYSGCDIYQKILLNVSKDDVHYALQNINVD